MDNTATLENPTTTQTTLASEAHAPAATVNLLLRREDVRDPLDAMGFVVPSRERRFLMSTSFISTKYPGRIPEGHVLLRAFVGGARHPQQVELDDAAIVAGCLEDLDRLLGIRGAPVRTLVCRWRESMPQYLLGHLDRVAALEARADAQPGLWLAGNAYRGVGIPDCIRAGQGAARHALKWLSAKR